MLDISDENISSHHNIAEQIERRLSTVLQCFCSFRQNDTLDVGNEPTILFPSLKTLFLNLQSQEKRKKKELTKILLSMPKSYSAWVFWWKYQSRSHAERDFDCDRPKAECGWFSGQRLRERFAGGDFCQKSLKFSLKISENICVFLLIFCSKATQQRRFQYSTTIISVRK